MIHSYSICMRKYYLLTCPIFGIGVCIGDEHVSETQDCNVEQSRQKIAIPPYTENSLSEMQLNGLHN